jgi:hypothetical protein
LMARAGNGGGLTVRVGGHCSTIVRFRITASKRRSAGLSIGARGR